MVSRIRFGSGSSWEASSLYAATKGPAVFIRKFWSQDSFHSDSITSFGSWPRMMKSKFGHHVLSPLGRLYFNNQDLLVLLSTGCGRKKLVWRKAFVGSEIPKVGDFLSLSSIRINLIACFCVVVLGSRRVVIVFVILQLSKTFVGRIFSCSHCVAGSLRERILDNYGQLLQRLQIVSQVASVPTVPEEASIVLQCIAFLHLVMSQIESERAGENRAYIEDRTHA